MMYYCTVKRGVTFTPSMTTIEWNDPILEAYRNYAENQHDKSLECTYDGSGMPVIKKYALDSNGERYRFYLSTPDADGIYQPDISSITTEQTNLAEKEANILKQDALNNITVTTSAGNVFDGNETARVNMSTAIQASTITSQTTTNWKLANNSVVTVSVDELKEALVLALQEVGKIVGAI